VRANRAASSRRILLPRAVNPTYAQVARSIAGHQGIAFEAVDFDRARGVRCSNPCNPTAADITALVIQQPISSAAWRRSIG